MPTSHLETTVPNMIVPGESPNSANIAFEYPGADLILRSCDSHTFFVPKLYVINSSPKLAKLIQNALNSSDVVHLELQLSDAGAIIHSLLTFIFPVFPVLPSTAEEIMELLSVAQKYEMHSTMAHIRGCIARQDSPFIDSENAFHVYSLAQKCGLRQEALQAARATLTFSITIEALEDKLDVMSGAALHELWKYHQRVRSFLVSDLAELRKGGVRACSAITSQTIRTPLISLAATINGSLKKAESTLALVQEGVDSDSRVTSQSSKMGSSLPQSLDVPDADLILRSADLVNFRVHKSVLSLASPFFKDMLSLPQPPDGEIVDGLPVVRLSEDSELLKYLIPMLYPVSLVLPGSESGILSLLATCQKYDMASIQSLIRARVRRRSSNRFGDDAFCTYAIASSKRLMFEMETAAHLTLGCPMTLDTIGERLRLFEGWALLDLVRFRKRCRDNVVACLESFLEVRAGPSKIWVGCPDETHYRPDDLIFMTGSTKDVLPRWLYEILERNKDKIRHEFTHPLDLSSSIRKEFSTALQTHADCHFCWLVHLSEEGSKFCDTLAFELYQACHKESVTNDRA